MIAKGIPPYQTTIALVITILYLTLLPHPLGEEELPLFDGADKIAHFMMFGVLTGAFIFDRWRIGRSLNMKGALATATVSMILGAGVEYLQYALAWGRSGNDIYDAMANALGAFTAVPVCRALHWIDVTVHGGPR